MRKAIHSALRSLGYDIVKNRAKSSNQERVQPDNTPVPDIDLPPDFNDFEKRAIRKVRPFTMTSPERIVSLLHSVQYVLDNKIEGSIVECGVWKGGSMMAAALALIELQRYDKDLYLFDTFDGMSSATDEDISICGDRAKELLKSTKKTEEDHLWAYSPLEKVQQAMYSVGYPKNKIHFIKGKVEETIPADAPTKISILRLDTDWYESTHHELLHLFPRLALGGVLIIDDYGHWQGARKAVDDYIKNNNIKILLNRVDYTGRIAVKQCQ